jgi:hypothetical protein
MTINAASRLIVNGGVVNGTRGLVLVGGTNTINGGTVDLAGPLGARAYQGSGAMELNGGTVSAERWVFKENTVATFGGSTAGSATFGDWGTGNYTSTGDRQQDNQISIDFRPGTLMTLTMTAPRALDFTNDGTDNPVYATNAWAEALWETGRLTYNGTNYTTLGSWAEVTAEDGLETGVRFDFDSDTETLALVSDVTLSGYGLWASGWSTNIGAATNDFDLDGLNNFYEYGLDGNPTNVLDLGTPPVFSKSGSGFLYVHPKRSDDPNVTYRVETTTNLVSGTWTQEGYTVTGTNVTGGILDFVTNQVDGVENEKFIRLKIEQ